MNNQPLFASSTGQAQDDFDLNEVFAEYFSNEFDLDPLNAYTSSMANFNGGATAVSAPAAPAAPTIPTAAQAHAAAVAQQNDSSNNKDTKGASAATVDSAATNGDSSGFNLPTGGIKTAFHIGSSVPSRPAGVIVPPQKRTKSSDEPKIAAALVPNTVNANSAAQQAPNTMLAAPGAMGGPVAALALAHQQAATAAAVAQHAATTAAQQHQQTQQLQQLVVAQQVGLLQQQQQQQVAAVAAAANVNGAQTAATTAAAGDARAVSLPVGVGIRLGGMGGIAPATAQATTGRPAVMQAQPFNAAAMWGAAAAGMNPSAGAAMLALTGGVGTSSDQAVAERRLRNREHAKRSRVRKKFMLESMQEQVRSLQIENQNLRLLVQEHIPEHAMSIISECCTSSPLFAAPPDATAAAEDDPTKLGKSDFSLMESLTTGQKCFVLSDPKLPDNPIVFASQGFYDMTGYTAKEVLGRNCRFLQGPGTAPRAVDVIRKAIASGADATVCLLNYKADGTPFWNQFFIAALRDSDNCIVNFVGVQCEVEPEQGDSNVEEKVNEVLPLAAKDEEEEGAKPKEGKQQ